MIQILELATAILQYFEDTVILPGEYKRNLHVNKFLFFDCINLMKSGSQQNVPLSMTFKMKNLKFVPWKLARALDTMDT